MRKFRFIGDPIEWDGDLKKNKVYEGVYKLTEKSHNVFDAVNFYPNDWQEVFDEPKKLHKDTDLGYFAGLAMQGYISSPVPGLKDLYDTGEIIRRSIFFAKELIKQLDQEEAK
jgi:hypothetical protein